MNRFIFLSGVAILLIGCVLYLGSFFLFNRHVFNDSHTLTAYSLEAWLTPNPPILLNKADEVTIRVTKSSGNNVAFGFMNQAGAPIIVRGTLTENNHTYTYHCSIPENGFYLCVLQMHGSFPVPYEVLETVSLEVAPKAPNLMFVVIGMIVLAGGAAAILISLRPR